MVLLLFVEENAERMKRKWGSVEFERGVRRRVTSFWVKKWRNFESPVPDRFLAVKLMNFFYIFFSMLSARKEKVADVAVDHLSIYTRLSRPPPFPSPSFRILRFALRETDTCLMHEFHSCRQFTSSLEPRVPNSTSRSAKLNSPVRGNVRRVRKVQFLPS